MRRRLAALVAVFVAAGGLAACGRSWEERCDTRDGVISCAPDDRPPAVALTGDLLGGGTFDLASTRGSVVVLNFWASWCGPCRAEAGDLERVYEATKDRGVTFVGIDHRDDRESAIAFQRGRATYPSLFDPQSKAALLFEIPPSATPSTLILDRLGRVAVAMRQATTADRLQPLVERVAAEAGPS
jgi:thiol-disulfide isomerase/thioredoxin